MGSALGAFGLGVGIFCASVQKAEGANVAVILVEESFHRKQSKGISVFSLLVY